MATEALHKPRSLPSRLIFRPVNRTAEHIFFGGMAILLCVIVIVGFSPTYFGVGMLRPPAKSHPSRPWSGIHALDDSLPCSICSHLGPPHQLASFPRRLRFLPSAHHDRPWADCSH